MSAYESLAAYIEKHEVSLHSINKGKLTKRDDALHHGHELLDLDTSSQAWTNSKDEAREALQLSMSTQLDHFMQRLKQNQAYRSNQLHRINKLFDYDVDIDTECNLEIMTVDEENRRHNQYEYEEFLLGIDCIPTDTEGDFAVGELSAQLRGHPEADLYDVADTLVEKLSLLRRERNNKLSLVAHSLASMCDHSTLLPSDKADKTTAFTRAVNDIEQQRYAENMVSPSLQSIADHW